MKLIAETMETICKINDFHKFHDFYMQLKALRIQTTKIHENYSSAPIISMIFAAKFMETMGKPKTSTISMIS